MKRSYKKIEFRNELSEKAFEIYSNSSFVFYKYNDENCYLCADMQGAFPYEIGTLQDVEEYLLSFAD